ncbi:MAG: CBS domain-containing protein [Thaumarchaeota archaeon]|nr:CBS domain-containing protein [Nitrososphaerota archaeon]
MNAKVTYDHLKVVREKRTDQVLSKATTIDPSFTISKVISIMNENDVYDVFCMKGNSVFTINVKDLLAVRDTQKMKADSLLRRIQPLSKNSMLEEAASMLTHYRMRSAPVVDKNQIIGVVKAKNIVELLAQYSLNWITVNTILTPNPITVDSKDTLSKARKIIMSNRIDHIPVINGNKVSSILTSMHLLPLLTPSERKGSDERGRNSPKRFDSQVGNIGSTRVPQCNTNDSLDTVIKSMLKANTSCCLLTLWRNLHGIITYGDLLNLLEKKISSEVPLYIMGLPEDLSNAEIVKTKFQKIIKNLTKVYPEVEEARASIRIIHKTAGENKNFEVALRILTPYETHSYTEMGRDLSKIFDTLGQRVIRTLSQRSKKRWKMSIRKIDKSKIF